MRRKLIILFAILGLIDAAYLTYHHYANTSMVCVALHGCDYVTTSEYSEIFGIPISLLGILYYLAIVTLTIISVKAKDTRLTRRILSLNEIVILIGTITYAYLIYVQADILNAYCIYCLFSAFCTFLIFILNSLDLRKSLTS